MSVKAAFQPTGFLGAYGHDANRWMIEGSSTATAQLVQSPGRYRLDGSDSFAPHCPPGRPGSTSTTPRFPHKPPSTRGDASAVHYGGRSTPLVVVPPIPDRFLGLTQSLDRPLTERCHRPITTQNGREYLRTPARQHGWSTSRTLTAAQMGTSSWLNKYSPTRTRQEQAFVSHHRPPVQPGDWVKVTPFQKWSWVKSQGENVCVLRPERPLSILSSRGPQMHRDVTQVMQVPTPPRTARRRVYCSGAR